MVKDTTTATLVGYRVIARHRDDRSHAGYAAHADVESAGIYFRGQRTRPVGRDEALDLLYRLRDTRPHAAVTFHLVPVVRRRPA